MNTDQWRWTEVNGQEQTEAEVNGPERIGSDRMYRAARSGLGRLRHDHIAVRVIAGLPAEE